MEVISKFSFYFLNCFFLFNVHCAFDCCGTKKGEDSVIELNNANKREIIDFIMSNDNTAIKLTEAQVSNFVDSLLSIYNEVRGVSDLSEIKKKLSDKTIEFPENVFVLYDMDRAFLSNKEETLLNNYKNNNGYDLSNLSITRDEGNFDNLSSIVIVLSRKDSNDFVPFYAGNIKIDVYEKHRK